MLFSPLEQFNVFTLCPIFFYGYDFSILSVLLPFFFMVMLLRWFIKTFLREFRLIPEMWQFSLESLFKFVLDMVKQQCGREGLVFFPFIFSLFIFILLCNLLGLIPFGIPLTSHFIIVASISFSLWSSILVIGLLRHNIKFLALFIPEAPLLILALLVPIEIVSYCIRALSLALRLSANIMAGHILVYIASSFVLYMGSLKFFFFIVALFLFFLLFLEIGVAFVQAYVFTVLFCIYLNDSLKVAQH